MHTRTHSSVLICGTLPVTFQENIIIQGNTISDTGRTIMAKKYFFFLSNEVTIIYVSILGTKYFLLPILDCDCEYTINRKRMVSCTRLVDISQV